MTTATVFAPRASELGPMDGGWEHRHRPARPEVDEMLWAQFDPSVYSEAVRAAASESWTAAAFREYRDAAACASTLRALIDAAAPLDLLAAVARFPLDEIAHVELCARMATVFGGSSGLYYAPPAVDADGDPAQPPLLRAAELVTRIFCVGDAVSVPLLHGAWTRAADRLPRAVLGRIIRDEAAHGVIGWAYLDWAVPQMPARDVELVRKTAIAAIAELRGLWDDMRRRPRGPASDGHPLGWIGSPEYLDLADRSLDDRVAKPFAARGIDVSAALA